MTGVRSYRLRAVAAAGVLLGTVSIGMPAASATYPGQNGRIAFMKNGDIYTVRADGTGQRRLTSTGDNDHPVWNAVGTKLAFDSRRTGNYDVYVMDADGSHLVQVTRRSTSERLPYWSPDGRQLAFTSDRLGAPQVFRIRSGAPFGESVQLTTKFSGGGFFSLTWSPDGRTIYGGYFSSDVDGDTVASLYRFAAVDGSRLTYVLRGFQPDVRPQGDRIAYEGPDFINVYTADRDGTAVRQVTHDTDPNQYGDIYNPWPSWSPNGALLAFGHINGQAPAEDGLYIARSDGTGKRLLVPGGLHPAWQPRP